MDATEHYKGKRLTAKSCWLGNEYLGCCNSGAQPRLVAFCGGYAVGLGYRDGFNGDKAFYSTEESGKARRHFLRLCKVVEEANDKTRVARASALEQSRNPDFNTAMAGSMALLDF